MIPRTLTCAIALLAAVPLRGAAQQGRWRADFSLGQVWFGSAAEDGGTSFRPSPGLMTSVGVTRTAGRWEFTLAADHRPSVLRAADSSTVIEVPGAGMRRIGLAFGAGRQLARWGSAQFAAHARFRADVWSLSESDNRFRPGGELQMAMRLDAGPFALTNALTAGLSASPLADSDLPEGYRRQRLTWFTLGTSLSFGL